MFRNYLLVALRQMARARAYTAINLLGLTLGMACCLLLLLFVRHEYSYDRFLPGVEQLYRVDNVRYLYNDMNGRINNARVDTALGYERRLSAYVPAPLGPATQAEVPGILAFTRWYDTRVPVRVGTRLQTEPIAFVDSGFSRVFGFEVLAGDYLHALDRKDQVVLNRSLAESYFGTAAAAVGKTVEIRVKGQFQPFAVAAVLADAPSNASVQYNILMRVEHSDFFAMLAESWTSSNTPLFVRVVPGTQPAALDRALSGVTRKYLLPEYTDPVQRARIAAGKPVAAFQVLPLTEMHLYREAEWDNGGNRTYIQVLAGLALLVLLVACINYLVLALSRAMARSKEVSLRVTAGASRRQLLGQFLLEAGLLVLGSFALALVLADLVLPKFSDMAQRRLHLPLNDLGFWLWVLGGLGATVLAAGAFPALWMARVRTAQALKGRVTARINPSGIRTLVALQFTVSIFLMGCTLVLFRQANFLLEKELGFDNDNVAVVQLPQGLDEDRTQLEVQRLRTALTAHPAVEAVAPTSVSFARGWSQYSAKQPDGSELLHVVYRVDDQYLPALGIPLLAGRNFGNNPAAERDHVILNQQAAKQLGFTPAEAVGKEVLWTGQERATVIGVVPDYHFQSLETEIKPMLLFNVPEVDEFRAVLVRLRAGQIPEGMAHLQATYTRLLPEQPFDARFLRADLDRQYADVLRWQQILSWGAGFALLIAVMGIVGLTGVNAMNRVKEIGIRKVLGARTRQIVLLLNRDLALVLLLAALVAGPLAYIAASYWLDTFAYRIALTPLHFAAAGALVALVAGLGVSFHSLRAATANPADSLRNE